MIHDSCCLRIIRCKCGFGLRLLADVHGTGLAIEKHALAHGKKCGLTKEEAESLKDYLIAQAFKFVSEMPKQENYGKA